MYDNVLLAFDETVWIILKLSTPLLLVSMVLGLVIAVFQAATQIHEQTITFVPKIIAIALLLVLLGTWMLTSLSDFFAQVLTYAAG
ncbi:MAG: flagellar biosynthesis protein FliQ [Ruminococcaceae bacterium]|nr:flagellar biosynthesis protein FliQ [Oscillospiraceae bacterium]